MAAGNVDILQDALRTAQGPSTHLGKLFTEHVREIVYRETGLPPCDEVNLTITESAVNRSYRLNVTFPPTIPGDTLNVYVDVTHHEWAAIGPDIDRQLHTLEFIIIKVAHKWLAM